MMITNCLRGGTMALAMLLLIACGEENEQIPDVSGINVETTIVRFDSLLYAVRNVADLKKLEEQYPGYYGLYFQHILGLKNARNTDSLYVQVEAMQAAETFRLLDQKIDQQYGQIHDIDAQWKKAMAYYTYYFTPQSVPDLYTTVTEFAFGTFIFPVDVDKDGIGVSLDMFLGDSMNYGLMAKLDASFSEYNARTFNRDHLIKKSVDALLDDLLPPDRDPMFLHQLLREGKKYYISDNLLPFVSDTAIWEYTADQWQWVKDNEWNIYSFLVTNELFYTTQRSDYIRLLRPAPHTIDMPPEAPGRAVIYIGYQIIRSYMNRHPETTMEELLRLPAIELFEAAKYKPRR